jgi:hypothetical protein
LQVAFADGGRRLVGEASKDQHAANTVYSAAKRLLGQRFSDEVVQWETELLPYVVALQIFPNPLFCSPVEPIRPPPLVAHLGPEAHLLPVRKEMLIFLVVFFTKASTQEACLHLFKHRAHHHLSPLPF